MRPLHAILVALSTVSFPVAGACDQDRLAANTETSFVDSSSPARGDPVPTDGGRVQPFFGYLEYDWDANAPGGVPGFGPLSKEVLIVARGATE